MKLPPDYKVGDLSELRRLVRSLCEQEPEAKEIEMTEAQYVDYARLVWLSDPIRRFEGLTISLTPKAP